MHLSILAIGKMKSGPESELLARYLDRAAKSGRQLGVTDVLVHEWTESKSGNLDQRKADEGAQLLSAVKSGGVIFCLDERGKDLSSQEFADILQSQIDNGIPQIAFALGGPDGHSTEFRKKSDRVIRFGKATWPHQLARIMLAEQIYRAITILSGHPYHRV